MADIIANPHDYFFKTAMQDVRVAREFFEWHLPAEISQRINYNTLEQIRESFIDEAFKATSSDIIYRVATNIGRHYLYALVEHQSTVDVKLPLRIMSYMLRLLKDHDKKYPKEPLPLVLPLIFYNGVKAYHASTDFFTLFADQSELARKYFTQPMTLINLPAIQDEEIRSRQWAGLMHFVMKTRRIIELEKFTYQLTEKIRQVEAHAFDYAASVLHYVMNGLEADGVNEFIASIQRHVSPQLGEKAMTFAQELIQQGMEKGLEKGMEKGLEKGMEKGLEKGMEKGLEKGIDLIARKLYQEGMTFAFIERVTGLSQEKIQQLLKG